MSEENQGPKVYTVTELTASIQDLLEEHFDFVWLRGRYLISDLLLQAITTW